MTDPQTRLARRLNLTDAIFLGLGSMMGAGIFAAAGPAAQAAGTGLLPAILIACALTFAFYIDPLNARPIAITAVLIMTFINLFGVKKTAFATKALVSVVLIVLGIVAFAALAGGGVNYTQLSGWTDKSGLKGILEASGFLFFAFAGYARIATLGEAEAFYAVLNMGF